MIGAFDTDTIARVIGYLIKMDDPSCRGNLPETVMRLPKFVMRAEKTPLHAPDYFVSSATAKSARRAIRPQMF